VENGARELELLFRAIVYHPTEPILIADNDRNYRDASAGAGKLFGLPRDEIIGRRTDDFVAPSFKPQISQLWQALRHVLVLRDKTARAETEQTEKDRLPLLLYFSYHRF
jgi:PAS domain S-box-containing protein